MNFTMNPSHRPRLYNTILQEHLAKYRQMAFLSGPRQSGKTTLAKDCSTQYLNWDREIDRKRILAGQEEVAVACGLDRAKEIPEILVFDEIHKYPRWKSFLKGFFDTHGERARILATGSAKMDVYKRGGDSMVGRYFSYRIHPFSVAEVRDVGIPPEALIRPQGDIPDDDWNALWDHGGFPEPFTMRERRFTARWNTLRYEQLFQSDVRDLTRISEIDQFSILAEILRNRSGEQLVYSSLGNDVHVDEKTIKSWVTTLRYLYYGFEVRPWFQNVENAIRKTPKWYLRDWSIVEDEGKKAETFVACHLLKAVEGWTDMGFGEFSLYYVRDKQKHEVDFLVTKNRVPWFLVEVKQSSDRMSPSLVEFHRKLGTQHAFQVVWDLPYENVDAFSYSSPVIVPARTLLGQLL